MEQRAIFSASVNRSPPQTKKDRLRTLRKIKIFMYMIIESCVSWCHARKETVVFGSKIRWLNTAQPLVKHCSHLKPTSRDRDGQYSPKLF